MMIDIVPTILGAAGIPAPVMVNGVAQKPIEGVSMTYTFDKANANTPSTLHPTQYFEMQGDRAIYHDGWVAATTPAEGPWLMGMGKLPDVVNGYKWELYNIADDYSENNDLAAKMPNKLRDMQELFLVEAAKNYTCSRWTTRFWCVPLPRDQVRLLAEPPFTYANPKCLDCPPQAPPWGPSAESPIHGRGWKSRRAVPRG